MEDAKRDTGKGHSSLRDIRKTSRVSQEQSTGMGDPVTPQHCPITAWNCGLETEIQGCVLRELTWPAQRWGHSTGRSSPCLGQPKDSTDTTCLSPTLHQPCPQPP